MDAVYLFAAGGEDELRHSLRSLANLKQVDRVAVAGYQPGWLTDDVVRVVPDNHRPGKHFDTWANLAAAVADRRLSDDFVLMNDDFYALQPLPVVPVWQHGVLSKHIARTHEQDRRRDSTIDMLERVGAYGRLSYELHVPMVMHRPAMRALMRRVEAVMPARAEPPWKRTVYGNYAHPGVGELHDDVKIRDYESVPGPADLFVSTSDYTWRRGAVGQWLRDRFSVPSRWEREGVPNDDPRGANPRRRPADAGSVRASGQEDRVYA